MLDRTWRLSAIGGLTIGQAVPSAFVMVALPTIFRKNGLDLDQFWIFALPLVPVWFKWMWAPIVDRYGSARFGRRRSWLLPCTLVGALAYGSLTFVKPEPSMIWPLVIILTLRSVVIATQDIAADAYTIESLNDSEKPLGSSVVTVSEIVANLSATAGLMWLYDRFGWDVTVVAAAATLVLFTLPALTREPVPRVQTQKPSLKAFVKRPEALTIVITVLIVSFSMGITTAIDGAFLVDKGLSVAEVGIVLGIGQLAGYFLGVIASPLLSKVLKPSTSLGFGVAVLPMALLPPLVLSFLPAVDVVTASIAFGIGALGYGHLIVLYNAARFEWADTGQGGTDYAIQGSLVRVAGSAVTAVAGLTAATIGWTGFYLVALIFALICGLFFTWSSRRIRSLRAHRPEPASPARTPLIGEIETGRHVADAAIQ